MPKKNLTPYVFYMNENVAELKNPNLNNRSLLNAVNQIDQKWKAMNGEEKAVWKEKLERLEDKNTYRVYPRLLHMIGNLKNVSGGLEQTSKYRMVKLDIPKTYADIPLIRERNKQLLLDMWNFQSEKVPMKVMNQIYYIAGVWEKSPHMSSAVVEVCVTGFTLQEGVVCCFYDYYDTGDPRSWDKLGTDMEEATLTCINEINFLVPFINYVAFEKLIKRAQANKIPTNTGFSVKVIYAEDFFAALKLWVENHRETLSDYFDSTAFTETAVPKIRCDYHRMLSVQGGELQCCPVDFVSYFIGRYFNYLRQALPDVGFACRPLAYFKESTEQW
ncbi:HMG box domain containing protein [Trichuris trichiura]|uniref:HMG box domain containing protein n=1 Tax=Trichuris trichiura TaxID=36087 RepID=A0A077ZM54_TRITR|nr:HMG box domain containing protein [Trichuris trichiura]